MQTLELNQDQLKAHEEIVNFVRRGKNLLTLGGFAGTGKTTLIAHAVKTIKEIKQKTERDFKIAFCAFTGKAASVLRSKLQGIESYDQDEDYSGTIHGLIYTPIFGAKGVIAGFELLPTIDYDLIIVDEASMLNEAIYKDLSSFGIPIIAVGDHGQLPPVFGDFNLMANPDIRLEKIMRQAEGDPIVRLSFIAREYGRIEPGEYGPGVSKVTDRKIMYSLDGIREKMILCGRNKTRVFTNKFVRGKLGINSSSPVPGEKVICLKNNRKAGIYNGNLGILKEIKPSGRHWFQVKIQMEEDFLFDGTIFRHQFDREKLITEWEDFEYEEIGNLFDFAYCMTVHKSQGSESDDVVVIEERMGMQTDDDWRRWLYTAITRSKSKILIIGE